MVSEIVKLLGHKQRSSSQPTSEKSQKIYDWTYILQERCFFHTVQLHGDEGRTRKHFLHFPKVNELISEI